MGRDVEWALGFVAGILGLFIGAFLGGWSRGRALAAAEAERDRARAQRDESRINLLGLQTAFRAAVEAEVAARALGADPRWLLRPGPDPPGPGAPTAPGPGAPAPDGDSGGRDRAPPGTDAGPRRRVS